MSELMLVGNPRRKRRRVTRRRKAVVAPRKRRSHRRRRTALLAAPRTHRRRSRVTRRRVHHRRRTSLRRNPIRMGNFNSIVRDTLMPASVGALGALGVDLALGYAGTYLPASLQSGMGATVAKLGGALAVGYVATKTMGRRFGEQATVGAVVVTIYDLLKSQVMAMAPALPLHGMGGMGWTSPALAINGVNAYVGTDNAYSGGMNTSGSFGMYVGEREGDYYRY